MIISLIHESLNTRLEPYADVLALIAVGLLVILLIAIIASCARAGALKRKIRRLEESEKQLVEANRASVLERERVYEESVNENKLKDSAPEPMFETTDKVEEPAPEPAPETEQEPQSESEPVPEEEPLPEPEPTLEEEPEPTFEPEEEPLTEPMLEEEPLTELEAEETPEPEPVKEAAATKAAPAKETAVKATPAKETAAKKTTTAKKAAPVKKATPAKETAATKATVAKTASAPKKSTASAKKETPVVKPITKPAPKYDKYVVKYDSEKKDWVVSRTGNSRATRRVRTKAEALAIAKDLSQGNDTSLVVHKKDGKFQKI